MTLSLILDDEGFRIYATSYGRTAPAGPRLFRAPPWPNISFISDMLAEGEANLAALQHYLDALPVKKVSKAKARKMGAD